MFSGLTMLMAASKSSVSVTNTINVLSKKTGLAGWISQGGPMMIPIIVGSVVALAIVIERILYLRRARIDTERFMDKIKRVLKANRVMEALVICENTPGPIANLVRAGIELHGKKKHEIKEAIEEASTREVPKLEKFLPALGTIAHISPLLGLLGTVVGMIKSSDVLATRGTSDAVGLIGGISEALITTAAGLFVAIPALILYNYLINKVNNLVLEMEIRSTELVNVLTNKDKTSVSKNWERI